MRLSKWNRIGRTGLSLILAGAWGHGLLGRNIVGHDDRVPLDTAKDFPENVIGRFDGTLCTGVLVGERLVLTAAHCVVDGSSGKPLRLSYFRVGLENQSFSQLAWPVKSWIGTYRPAIKEPDPNDSKKKVPNRPRDFAIVKLERVLKRGSDRPRVEAVDFERVALPYTIDRMAAFDHDVNEGYSLSVQKNCKIRKLVDGELYNDCDSAPGASGGPLFREIDGKPRIVAMMVSEKRDGASTTQHLDRYSDTYANVAIAMLSVKPVLDKLLETEDRSGEGAHPKIPGVFEVDNGPPYASVCEAYEGNSADGVNPKTPNRKESIADLANLKRYVRRNGLEKLRSERKGPPYGLTAQQCNDTLKSQKHGLLCGAGLVYNIFRARNGLRLGGDDEGWAFQSLEECHQAVRLSTKYHVCSWKGPDELGVYRILDGALVKTLRKKDKTHRKLLNECYSYIKKDVDDGDGSDGDDDPDSDK